MVKSTVLTKDQIPAPIRWLTTTSNSSSKQSSALFWPLWSLHLWHSYMHAGKTFPCDHCTCDAHTYMQAKTLLSIKLNKSLSNKMGPRDKPKRQCWKMLTKLFWKRERPESQKRTCVWTTEQWKKDGPGIQCLLSNLVLTHIYHQFLARERPHTQWYLCHSASMSASDARW